MYRAHYLSHFELSYSGPSHKALLMCDVDYRPACPAALACPTQSASVARSSSTPWRS